MLENIMTLFQNLKSTYLHQLWQVLEHLFKQYASCVLVDVDDTLPSIFSSDIQRNYVAQSGIGINAGRIRGINSRIRAVKSNTQSCTIPQKFEATVKCCTQNVRGKCYATVHFPI